MTGKTKKRRTPPTEAEIHATADVIAARLRDAVPAPLTLHVGMHGARAHLWLSHPSLPDESFPFMDLDAHGVDVRWPDDRFRRLTRGIGNVLRIVQPAMPLLTALAGHVMAEEAAGNAGRHADEISAKLRAWRGIAPNDESIDLPIAFSSGRADRGVTCVTIEVPHARIAAIADDLATLLRAVHDLVAPLDGLADPRDLEGGACAPSRHGE